MTTDNQTPDLDHLMEQEGRKLLVARMLPNEGPLTTKQQLEVVATIKAYLAKHAIFQNALAKQVPQVGEANISAILRGKYRHGSLDDHLRELNNWMEVDARRRQSKPESKFVETRVAKRILACAEKASQLSTMAAAHGPTGIGKTMVAHVLAEKFPGAVYIRLSAGTTSMVAVRRVLANRLRLGAASKKKTHDSGMSFDERIFDRLRSSNRLIIIDEAHRISDGALEFLRDVHDECGVPILFLCTIDLIERIRRDSDQDHGQLYSRFGYIRDVTKGYDKMPGGRNPLFTVGEIRRLFEAGNIKLHLDAQAYLQDVANMLGHGSLRRCAGLMKIAVPVERAQRNLGPTSTVTITAALLRKLESELMHDPGMLEDIRSRHAPAARTA